MSTIHKAPSSAGREGKENISVGCVVNCSVLKFKLLHGILPAIIVEALLQKQIFISTPIFSFEKLVQFLVKKYYKHDVAPLLRNMLYSMNVVLDEFM